MDKLIYTAMTGAGATLQQQAAVAQNLANVSSTGYKSEEHRLRAVPVISDALPTRAFVTDASVASDFTPGPIQQTGRPLDVALAGPGWLTVQMPDGSEAYTRNGNLAITPEGLLQTKMGLPVLAGAGPITLPPDNNITIGPDGTITAIPRTGSLNSANMVGLLKLVNPPEQDLVRGEDGLFRLKNGGQAEVDPNVTVAGGFLEGSNVNTADQMVRMISLARQFEMQTKMIQTAQQNDQAAQQLLADK
ncbi:MAG: flagellar basal body rod protein FlgF [Rhodocyclaceae bacterium]|nr:flagellar basal body rod protein FlgF [Rhodocyclaceae bacterium]